MRKSILGNLRYNNSSNVPKKILHFPDFSSVTLGTPVVVGSSTKQYTQTITSSSIVSSVMNGFFDTNYTLQMQLTADRDIVGADAAAKVADLTTLIENSIVTVPGPYGTNVQALYQNTKTRTTAIGTANSQPQNWFRVLRDALGAGGSGVPGSAMKKFYCSYWVKMQVDGADPLATNLDFSHVSGNAFWRVFFDVKSGGYLGYEGGGDLRITVRIHEDATGLYWRTQMDNSAANAPISIPGVTGSPATFWQVDSRESIPSDGEWFKFEVEMTVPDPVTRSYPSDHPDLTTGRTKVSITRASTMQSVVICDKRGGVHMGVHDLPWSQMFFAGVYSLAGGQINQYIYDLQIWDKTKRELGYIDARNHGPLPWVPTPLSKGTMFGASDGNDANPGTEASPKTYQGAINAATAPGSVVFFRGGTIALTTAAHLSLWNVGTAEQPIIYEAYPGETVIIDGSAITPGVGNQRRVNFSDSYQKLRGVIIQYMPEYGVYSGGTHNTVDGNEIRYCKLSGILNTGSYNSFINNWIHHCSDVGLNTGNYADGGNADGISISSGTGNSVMHNLIEDCADDGADTWQSQSPLVRYNIVRRIGLGSGNGNGIKAGGASVGANAVVDHNLVYDVVNNGVDANTGINVTMRKNTVWGVGGVAFVLEADTICEGNVESGNGSTKTGTGIPTRNSWDRTGTLAFESTTEGDADFLAVTQDGTFDGIGAHYL